ncbi:MAG: phosphoenolpyruvate carboxykinase (ATP) [Clostridia bacterium]|nr:phosphoenolpyruvate carboxykinase (ATP) [Clostridia bacterium]
METYGIEKYGIINPKAVHRNLPVGQQVQRAVERGEGVLSNNGALCVFTGQYTGRSTEDRFVVDTPGIHDDIAWGKVNVPISDEKFQRIYSRMQSYLQNRELFIFDGYACADPAHRLNVRVINEFVSQNMFISSLLIKFENNIAPADFKEDFTVICAPGFKCIPELDGVRSEAAIILNIEERLVIVAGSQYSGEMKKSVFATLNYLLPKKNVFPMHCSANMGKKGDVALFFGLSGTGKTTLSADPQRYIIGDDEHGWSTDGIFNFEGGCYAKCINLRYESEPQIWDSIKFGSLVENVVYDEFSREFDYDDETFTENTRVGFPITFIPNAVIPGVGKHPDTVVFLTADAFGVMPPIARLTPDAAMYHFLSGYTARLAGTERGLTKPEPVFSTCFGGPFMPMRPSVYAKLLGDRLAETGAKVYLVNTGWTGGPPGVGHRMSIAHTRAMITAVLEGELDNVPFAHNEFFNLDYPTACPGVPAEVLNPENTWADKAAYREEAKKVSGMFAKNFEKYPDVPQSVKDAGPQG